MTELTTQQANAMSIALFEQLLSHPDGMKIWEAVDAIQDTFLYKIPEENDFTQFKSSQVEKHLRFITIDFVEAGWLIKDNDSWQTTKTGKDAYQRYKGTEKFYQIAQEESALRNRYKHYSQLSSKFISVILTLDALSILLLGLYYLAFTSWVDPVNVDDKEAIMSGGKVMALLSFGYGILCFVSLHYWQKGRLYWQYVIMSLALLHIAFSGLFFYMLAPILYLSVSINLLLVAVMVFDRFNQKKIARNNGSHPASLWAGRFPQICGRDRDGVVEETPPP